ncbi:MAG TPA: hypothetical protein DCY27_10005 [Desulfobacterales bacterium]|nr:hypothetical protein [Desulfobacterales bacterium]
MKKVAVLSMFLIVLGFAAMAQAATVTVYTDYTAWQAAIEVSSPPPFVTENFEDPTLLPGFSITEVNGAGTINAGVYTNIVDDDALGGPRYQIFNYAPGMDAWGGFISLTPGGPGSSIDVYINDFTQFVMNIPNTAIGEFFGFTSDMTFTGVLFKEGPGSAQETYFSVDMSISPIPIPPTALLMGGGLLGLVGLGWRRRKSN